MLKREQNGINTYEEIEWKWDTEGKRPEMKCKGRPTKKVQHNWGLWRINTAQWNKITNCNPGKLSGKGEINTYFLKALSCTWKNWPGTTSFKTF